MKHCDKNYRFAIQAARNYSKAKNPEKIIEAYEVAAEVGLEKHSWWILGGPPESYYASAGKIAEQLSDTDKAIELYNKAGRVEKAKALNEERSWVIPEYETVDNRQYWQGILTELERLFYMALELDDDLIDLALTDEKNSALSDIERFHQQRGGLSNGPNRHYYSKVKAIEWYEKIGKKDRMNQLEREIRELNENLNHDLEKLNDALVKPEEERSEFFYQSIDSLYMGPLRLTGRYEEAIDFFKKWGSYFYEDEQEKSPDRQKDFGILYELAQKYDAALDCYQ